MKSPAVSEDESTDGESEVDDKTENNDKNKTMVELNSELMICSNV